DLDHFKDINDQFGHGAGDQLLQAVARALSFVRRRDETVGRWGGEEFAVLIQPVAGRLELAAAVERLRTIVPRARIVAGEDLVHVTASAGAALARPGERLENLWSRVDRLLYQSKREGRDRLALEDDAG
ncbi:MAG: GGDEF domain-containing protein, partial [Candidatus Polarisedimenticolia bacterium]